MAARAARSSTGLDAMRRAVARGNSVAIYSAMEGLRVAAMATACRRWRRRVLAMAMARKSSSPVLRLTTPLPIQGLDADGAGGKRETLLSYCTQASYS